MARTPSGTTVAIATAFASALSFTAATNASEAVLTVTGATLSAGDFVEVTSTWGRINGRIFRLKTATATALTLESCDTTNTSIFPAGLGAGSVRKISTWTPVTQVLGTPESSGGEAKNANFQYLDSQDEQTVFDGYSALTYSITLDADSIGTPAYTSIKTLSDSNGVTALRLTAPGGATVLLGATLALNENPTMAAGQVMGNKVTFYGRGRTVRYAS